MIQVGDTVRVREPDADWDPDLVNDRWRVSVGEIGRVIGCYERGVANAPAAAVQCGDSTYAANVPVAYLERVEPEAPAADKERTMTNMPACDVVYDEQGRAVLVGYEFPGHDEEPAADDDTTITVSSGNPYADLGLSNPEQRLADARKRIAQQHGSVGSQLDAALVSLREALAISSRAGDSVTRLVALTELIGHVDRCVRELPE